MSVGIDGVGQLDGIAIVRLHARPDERELTGVISCWRALQADIEVRAVAVVSVSEDFGAAVVTDAADLVTIAPKSAGLLKPFGVGLRGNVFDYALQLLGEADTVVATSDARIADTTMSRGFPAHAAWLRGSLPEGEINRLALLGPSDAITAARAAELGLVDEIVDFDELESAGTAIAAIQRRVNALRCRSDARRGVKLDLPSRLDDQESACAQLRNSPLRRKR